MPDEKVQSCLKKIREFGTMFCNQLNFSLFQKEGSFVGAPYWFSKAQFHLYPPFFVGLVLQILKVLWVLIVKQLFLQFPNQYDSFINKINPNASQYVKIYQIDNRSEAKKPRNQEALKKFFLFNNIMSQIESRQVKLSELIRQFVAASPAQILPFLQQIMKIRKIFKEGIELMIINNILLAKFRELLELQDHHFVRTLFLLKYCISTFNMDLPLQQFPTVMQQLIVRSKQNLVGLQKCVILRTQQLKRPLPYQKFSPIVLVKHDQVQLEQQLSRGMCALANQRHGGFLYVVGQAEKDVVVKGIKNFTPKELNKFRAKFNSALALITNNSLIQTKVEGVPVYQIYNRCIQMVPGQFLIKIAVKSTHKHNKFHYLQHKVQNYRKSYQFFSLERSTLPPDPETGIDRIYYEVVKNEEQAIYQQMVNCAQNHFNQSSGLSKCIVRNIMSQIQGDNLDSFVKVEQRICKLYEFNFEPNMSYALHSLLYNCFKIQRADFQESFPDDIPKQHTSCQIQVIDTCNFKEVISEIENMFAKLKIEYRHWIPLQQLQESYNKFLKQFSPTSARNNICYFSFKGTYNSFLVKFRSEVMQKFPQGSIIIELVHSQIRVGMTISESQFEVMNNFLFEAFCHLPKTKKVPTNPLKTGELVFKNVELNFEPDKPSPLFSFFILTLSKKRPSCVGG